VRGDDQAVGIVRVLGAQPAQHRPVGLRGRDAAARERDGELEAFLRRRGDQSGQPRIVCRRLLVLGADIRGQRGGENHGREQGQRSERHLLPPCAAGLGFGRIDSDSVPIDTHLDMQGGRRTRILGALALACRMFQGRAPFAAAVERRMMMQKRSVDAVVIGAGSAGLNAAAELEKAGADWLLVEAAQYGTTCARVGCMPSKLLVAAADAADAVERAKLFGIRARDIEVDGEAVFDRVRRKRDRFVAGAISDTERLPAARRMLGRARFVGPTTVRVDETLELDAKAVVIATGSSTVVPPVFDAVRDRVLTSDGVFELTRVPESLAVIGTGIVGLELGQALGRLGAEVTFLDRLTNVGPLTDPELQRYIRTVLGRTLNLELGVTVESAEAAGRGIRLGWKSPEGEVRSGEFEQVLVAAGRRPNVAGLGLEKTGLELDERGMPMRWDPQTTQCGDAPIFLAGDVNNHAPLLHEAIDEGRIAGENAARYP